MHQDRSDLLIILRLLSGTATADQEQSARRRLSDDAAFRRHWHQVSRVWHSQQPPPPGESSKLSAELIAGFVDGGLSPEQSAHVEARCLNSAAALREVMHAFRSTIAAAAADPVADRLSERLIALGPAPKPAQPLAAPAMPRVAMVKPTLRRRRPHMWPILAAFGFIAALLALALWQGTPRDRDAMTGADPIPSGPGSVPEQQYEQTDSPTVSQYDPTDDVPPEIDRTPAVVDDPPVVANDRPPDVVAAETSTLQWTHISGLIAVQDSTTQRWRAGGATVTLDDQVLLSTSPGGRAEGRFGSQFALVLDGGTKVSLIPSSERAGLPAVHVLWGRCALLGLPEKARLTIAHGTNSRIVEVQTDGTAFAIASDGSSTTVQGIAGSALVDGESLSARYAVVLHEDRLESGVPASAPSWVNDPSTESALSSASLALLSASDDLERDLGNLLRQGRTPDAEALVTTSLAMAPEPMILASLNSEAKPVRVAALNWLGATADESPQRRFAWRAYVASLDDPQTARQMMLWLRAAGAPRQVDRQVASELLAGLDHPAVSVREAANLCLERMTQRQVAAFQADASPAERRNGIQRWRSILARLVGGRPAATRNGRR